MARTARVSGRVKPYLKITGLSSTGGSVTATEPSDDLISINLTDGDGNEAVTFSDFAEGITPKALEVSYTYSGVTASLWHLLDMNAGRTGVGFVWGPEGNSVAAAGKPVITGTVTLGPRPNLEQSASESDVIQNTDTWQISDYVVTRI